jgi:hypothetical protein
MRPIYDVFPADLCAAPADYVGELTPTSAADNTYRVGTCRVVLTQTHVLVAVDSPEGPQIVFREAYVAFERGARPSETSTVTTESGKRLAFRKNETCGCGSRLRSWNPVKTLATMYSSRDPR